MPTTTSMQRARTIALSLPISGGRSSFWDPALEQKHARRGFPAVRTSIQAGELAVEKIEKS